jgi:multisubunit Na+/H+ antiporter MnhB subunit
VSTVLTRMVARGLLAPTLVVAAAVLVKGYADVGDGFAAGVIAALGVLLQYLAFGRDAVAAALPVARAPAVALAGLAVGAAMFVVPIVLGGAPLEHWPPGGEEPVFIGSLELITAVLFDIGVFLLVLGSAVTIIDALAAPSGDEADRA